MDGRPLLGHDTGYPSTAPSLPPAVPQQAPRAWASLFVKWTRQALLMFLSLMFLTWLAACLYCKKFGVVFDKLSLSDTVEFGSCKQSQLATFAEVLTADAVLALFWIVGELYTQTFVDVIRDEIATGEAWQKSLDDLSRSGGMPPPSDLRHLGQHPPAWNEALRTWKSNHAEQAGARNKGIVRRAALFYFAFAVIMLVNLLIVFAVSPSTYNESSASFSELASNVLSFDVTGGYDYTMLALMAFEIGLFLVAVSCVVWPAKHKPLSEVPRFQLGVVETPTASQAGHGAGRDMFSSEDELAVTVASHPDVTAGLIPDVAVMIACHQSTITPERTEVFKNTLRAALRLFPAAYVFVCDNGRYDAPVDRTEDVCDEVSREFYPDGSTKLNYLFIPEGNKSHAMYWCTEHWIPALVAAGRISDPTYALVMDDDVPLPVDLQVPLKKLGAHPDIKAVSYAIEAATEDGSAKLLVDLQDAEYKLVGAMKQLQAKLGSAMYCHGALSIWRRDVLGKKVLWDHDTVFHGEDLYMGLLLHRLRRNYKIDVAAEAVVPTYAPETLNMLFKQRTRSWDLCAQRKVYSMLKEFCLGWCSGSRGLAIKPFLLYEVAAIVVDWLRLFLIVGLLFRNWFSFVVLLAVFWSLQWAELLLFNLVLLRNRPDLRIGVLAFLLFPAYKTMSMFFRVYAVMVNVIVYSPWSRKGDTINERERFHSDVPPVPQTVDPNWNNIWIPSSANARGAAFAVPPPRAQAVTPPGAPGGGLGGAGVGLSGASAVATSPPPADSFRDVVNALVTPLDFHEQGDRLRFAPMVEGYALLRKLLDENTAASVLPVLRAVGQDGDAAVFSTLLSDMRLDFENVFHQVIRHQYPRLMDGIHGVLERYARAGATIAVSTETGALMQCGDSRAVPAVGEALRGNQRVLHQISACLASTQYPQHQDRSVALKRAVASALESVHGMLVAIDQD